jgi:predicted acylesterase/phospholipase RssA
MLTLDPARGRNRSGGSIGLALAGGGPLGAFYELGALHALGEAVDGLDLTALDVYVGVSSGSLIAAGLANGFDTTSLGSIFITNDSSLYPFAPGLFARPAMREYLLRARRLPTLLAQALSDYARDPIRAVWAGTMESLAQAVPVAAFDNAPIGAFVKELLHSPGHTDDFRRLRAKLYVVATNLNTGVSVRFGEAGFDGVPISRAVMASTALPGLYPPVEIDGQSYVDGALIRTMNASLAFEAGCDLVICVNPLVAFDASQSSDATRVNLARATLPTILSQTFRALIQSRMHVGMASYRMRYPQADQMLIEPDRHDEEMFFVNVFRYRERQRLVDHAYQRTRADLLHHADTLEPVLARHGLALRRDVLNDRRRTFSTAIRARARAARRVTRDLAATLDRLEKALSSRGTRSRRSGARGGR